MKKDEKSNTNSNSMIQKIEDILSILIPNRKTCFPARRFTFYFQTKIELQEIKNLFISNNKKHLELVRCY